MSYLCTRIHLVWSTRYRLPNIDPAWQDHLFAFIVGLCGKHGIHVYAIGGTQDHIHVYVTLPPTMTIAQVVSLIKVASTNWIRSNHRINFHWQKEYGCFTASHSADARIQAYIHNQEQHHRRRNSRQEFLELLERHEVPHDPEYI